MTVFKTHPDGFAIIRKQTLRRTIPVILVALVIFVVINIRTSGTSKELYPLLIAAPLLLFVIGRSVYTGLKRRRRLFDSFTIEIDEDTVTRTQADTPALSLNRLEITSVSKDRQGIITIRGMDKQDLIVVPADMDRQEEMEAALARIIAFSEQQPRPLGEYYGWIATVVAIGLMVAVNIVENKIIVLVSGILLIGLLTWSLLAVYRNKNVSNRYKRSSWVVLLVIASVIISILTKLGLMDGFSLLDHM